MKKGITIVTLVITVIILIILTAAVMVTSMNDVSNVQLAVLESNIATVKEAVNVKKSSNLIKYSKERNIELYSWVGVIEGYTEEMAKAGEKLPVHKKILGSIEVSKLDIELNKMLNMKTEEFEKYLIDAKGKVYYDGYKYKGEIYYGINIKEPHWVTNINTNENLNEITPCITQIVGGVVYCVPIPKGFVVSTIEGETDISKGLVIYDTAVSPNNNQFVWVPVDNTYNITYALDTAIAGKMAIEYWKENKNGIGSTGYNEPNSRANGSWTKTEWDNMYASVIKYGGFYVGRCEVGKDNNGNPIVQLGKEVWNNIIWNDEMTAEPKNNTATYVARNMYSSTNLNYGVTSTLIYGIQWDSIMNWAECANATRVTGKGGTTGLVPTDCYNNIYDLAGNVREWTMEASYVNTRVFRGGSYGVADKVSARIATEYTYKDVGIGFRIALYIK